jgi:hypothetical protein
LPDLAPADFWLFPKVKLEMKRDHHDTIQRESTTVLNVMTVFKIIHVLYFY